jgi:hypothetical protein
MKSFVIASLLFLTATCWKAFKKTKPARFPRAPHEVSNSLPGLPKGCSVEIRGYFEKFTDTVKLNGVNWHNGLKDKILKLFERKLNETGQNTLEMNMKELMAGLNAFIYVTVKDRDKLVGLTGFIAISQKIGRVTKFYSWDSPWRRRVHYYPRGFQSKIQVVGYQGIPREMGDCQVVHERKRE